MFQNGSNRNESGSSDDETEGISKKEGGNLSQTEEEETGEEK